MSVEPESPPVVALVEPRDGLPDVIDTPEGLNEFIAAVRASQGPVAVDAERASGYRYSQRAYLIQIRREGAGTALIDPIALPDLSELSHVLQGTEWVLHAASQDLACLAETGLHPDRVFDTELAGRLLNYERVGLAAVVAQVLGLGLAKEHSAADWSTRPLPLDWLRYAALDVEVLVELRDHMSAELEELGKAQWAVEEFEAVRTAPPPPPRIDPWRRVSGLHDVRDPRRLAVVRQIWTVRDEEARHRDIAPGRVLPDRAIVAAALASPRSIEELLRLPVFSGRRTQRHASVWFEAIQQGLNTPTSELPPVHGPRSDGPPPVRAWRDRSPESADRLGRAREALAEIAETQNVPVENLVPPDLVRRLCWSPPHSVNQDTVEDHLHSGGARPWQIALTSAQLTSAVLGEP